MNVLDERRVVVTGSGRGIGRDIEDASTIGRTVALDEIAAPAVYLSSPLADAMNGQSIAIDGGIVYA